AAYIGTSIASAKVTMKLIFRSRRARGVRGENIGFRRARYHRPANRRRIDEAEVSMTRSAVLVLSAVAVATGAGCGPRGGAGAGVGGSSAGSAGAAGATGSGG